MGSIPVRVTKKNLNRFIRFRFFFLVPRPSIAPARAVRTRMGSHPPLGDRGARSLGGECADIRQRRNSRNLSRTRRRQGAKIFAQSTKFPYAPHLRCFFILRNPFIARLHTDRPHPLHFARRGALYGHRREQRADLYQDKHTPRCQSS